MHIPALHLNPKRYIIAKKVTTPIITYFLYCFLDETPFPLLSEEGKHLPYSERRAWDTLWIVDPLDGTKEFIKKNGEFTVNIALVHHSVPVMGVIYLPVKKELYFGLYELGAYKLSDITARDGLSWDELVAKAVRLP